MHENRLQPLPTQISQVLVRDVKDLPSFPPAIAKILALSGEEPLALKDISKAVETDPGISAKILCIVNSALYRLTRKITAVPEAVAYLGFDEVKKIALSVSVFEILIKRGRHKVFDRIFFWQHCLCVAALSQAIAWETRYPRPDEAYACGLLHDLGKIYFDLAGRIDYGDFIRRAAVSPRLIIKQEREFMGMGHDDLGAYYSTRWHLPDSLSLAARYHHRQFRRFNLGPEKDALIAIVSLANFLAWTQGMGSVNIIHPPVLQPDVEACINLEKINFKKVIRHMDNVMENTSGFYNFAFPSAVQFRENLLRTNLALSRINNALSRRAKSGAAVADTSQIRQSATAPHHSLDPKKIVTSTLKAIYNDFKFNRIYVLKIIRKKRHLKLVEFLDNTGTLYDRALNIPITKKAGGIIHCLRMREPVIITGRTSGEKQALKILKTKKMVIVPFTNQSRVIGILGMDTPAGMLTDSLTRALPLIAIVAGELGMALEHAAALKQARAVSRQDSLTGLLNRLAIDELLAGSFRKAVEKKRCLSLVMIDVDYFKKFNDRFGHQTGDTVLKLIAGTLKKLTRPFDHVGRYGGEEFIVILNNTGIDKAMIYAERIRRGIERLGKILSKRLPGRRLTVSAGVSEYKKGMENRDQIISLADQALYRAKETGRNRIAAA